MGYTILPPLLMVNDFGYNMIASKNFKQAFKLFQKSIVNYPSSFFVYDSMGDYYKEIGDKEKAIEYYKKTLSLFDYPETKSKLTKLQAEK